MLLASIVLAAALSELPLYGEDIIVLIAKKLGYAEVNQPCSADDGEVRVAVLKGGKVVLDGNETTAAAAGDEIYQSRTVYLSMCLYVEGPMQPEAERAFRTVESAIARANLSFARFADANFQLRVKPKMAGR